jgi:hypothetical protein
MQGTVVMLMAMSGLGCCNKYAVAYGPPTYSALFATGCYANYYPNFMASALVVPPSCYSPCYAGPYNGCYSACYPVAYRPKHSCCFVSKLFGCCGCGKAGYGDPYAGYGYMGPGPFPGGPGPFMDGPGPWMGGPGPMMGGPGPMMGGPGFGGPFEPPVFGYALQFNYGDPNVDSVPVPTVQPPASSTPGAPTPAPPSPGGATPVPPARDTGTTPPPPPPTPANVPGITPKPGV